MRSQYPAQLHPLLTRIEERVAEIRRHGQHPRFGDWAVLVEEEVRALRMRLPAELMTSLSQYHAHRLFDIGHRLQTLRWAAQWAERRGRNLRIYGNGWDIDPNLRQWAAGPVQHGEHLRRAYRGARLTLQTIPSGFWHQRSFEALASGSLVISRYSPWDFSYLSIEEYRQRRLRDPTIHGTPKQFPHFERVVFHNEEEFDALAEQLLHDDALRAQLLDGFRTVVMRHLTYDAVLPGLLETIRSGLSGAAATGDRAAQSAACAG